MGCVRRLGRASGHQLFKETLWHRCELSGRKLDVTTEVCKLFDGVKLNLFNDVKRLSREFGLAHTWITNETSHHSRMLPTIIFMLQVFSDGSHGVRSIQ